MMTKQPQFMPNRSQAVQAALTESLQRLARTRLACECAKLDPEEEAAEEGFWEGNSGTFLRGPVSKNLETKEELESH